MRCRPGRTLLILAPHRPQLPPLLDACFSPDDLSEGLIEYRAGAVLPAAAAVAPEPRLSQWVPPPCPPSRGTGPFRPPDSRKTAGYVGRRLLAAPPPHPSTRAPGHLPSADAVLRAPKRPSQSTEISPAARHMRIGKEGSPRDDRCTLHRPAYRPTHLNEERAPVYPECASALTPPHGAHADQIFLPRARHASLPTRDLLGPAQFEGAGAILKSRQRRSRSVSTVAQASRAPLRGEARPTPSSFVRTRPLISGDGSECQ